MMCDSIKEELKNHFRLVNEDGLVDKLRTDLPNPRAAILIPLFFHQDEIFVVLTQRSSKLKTHSGEVCFPGGKYDETDGCLADTALREACEEINLKQENVSILGQLLPLRTKHGVIVFPFVGVISNFETIKLKMNLDEVEHVFACPLKFFISSSTFTGHDVESNMRYIFTWTLGPNMCGQNRSNAFLNHVFDDNINKTFKIFGLTALYAIFVASLCLNQQPVPSITPQEYIKVLTIYMRNILSDQLAKPKL